MITRIRIMVYRLRVINYSYYRHYRDYRVYREGRESPCHGAGKDEAVVLGVVGIGPRG